MARAAAALALMAMAAARAAGAETPLSPSAPLADRQAEEMGQALYPRVRALARPPAAARLAQAAPLATLFAGRSARLAACAATDAACRIAAARWPEAERAALAQASGQGAPLARELEALDGVLAVYGLGAASRYPKIDGPVFAADSADFADSRAIALMTAQAAGWGAPDSLSGSLGLALALLDANGRDEAIRFAPLDARENAGAAARARQTAWSRYRYTALIVPGVGPEDMASAISPRSLFHATLAAQRFRAGWAPLIVVSGAAVHPRGTRFVEAVELRRVLVERFGVPASAIVLEPYARHTTTNLRNASRRLAALGVPLDRPALIVTDAEQSAYIEGPRFVARNAEELGYQPGAIGRRLSRFDLEFRPSAASLAADPRDPLDP